MSDDLARQVQEYVAESARMIHRLRSIPFDHYWFQKGIEVWHRRRGGARLPGSWRSRRLRKKRLRALTPLCRLYWREFLDRQAARAADPAEWKQLQERTAGAIMALRRRLDELRAEAAAGRPPIAGGPLRSA